jgi:hypothetical protein
MNLAPIASINIKSAPLSIDLQAIVLAPLADTPFTGSDNEGHAAARPADQSAADPNPS